MINTWKVDFKGQTKTKESLELFLVVIKKQVERAAKLSGKKYFNFVDMCRLQCITDNEDSFMKIFMKRSMTEEYVEDFVNNFSIDCFDDDYARSVSCFYQNFVQYCSVNNCFVNEFAIRFFFMDESENDNPLSVYCENSSDRDCFTDEYSEYSNRSGTRSNWEMIDGMYSEYEEFLLGKIKEEVRRKANSSGKKYFCLADSCIIQLREFYGSGDKDSELPFSMFNFDPDHGNAHVENFDRSYCYRVKDFMKKIKQYTRYHGYILLSVEMEFLLTDFCNCDDYLLGCDCEQK